MRHEQFEHQNAANIRENERFELQTDAKYSWNGSFQLQNARETDRTGDQKKQNRKNKQFPKQFRTHTYVYIYTYPNPQRPQNKVLSKGPLISPKDLKGPLNWPMDPEASCVYWIGLRDQTTKHLRGDVDIHGRSNKTKYAMLKRCNLRAQNIEPHSSQGQPELACCPNSFWFPNSTSIEAG